MNTYSLTITFAADNESDYLVLGAFLDELRPSNFTLEAKDFRFATLRFTSGLSRADIFSAVANATNTVDGIASTHLA
jgi:hypothetical protein